MDVYKITDTEFNRYGKILSGYDFTNLLNVLSQLYVPGDGIIYEASVKALEQDNEFEKLCTKGFGGMPIQIGYVGGNNKTLNCLEYHKSSEFNIALNDVVLVLGKLEEIKEGKFDTSLCKAFLLPASFGVELYATTLHYAPMNVEESFRVACVLPAGTNKAAPIMKIFDTEDKMCAGANKWLMAHSEADEAKKGMYVGLKGENIAFNKLKF